jgi:hypothetical protein
MISDIGPYAKQFECTSDGFEVTGGVTSIGGDFNVTLYIEGKHYTFGMRRVYVLPEKFVIPRIFHVMDRGGRRESMELSLFTEQDAVLADAAFERGVTACVVWHQALTLVKNRLKK